MKVLFLDIDGVLNKDTTKERVGFGRFKDFIGLDKKLLELYLGWIKGKPIEVVISSTWRLDKDQLTVMAFNGLRWLDVTPNRGYRGAEIEEWRHRHSVTEYAILDDIQQFYPCQHKHFVQTSYVHGLRPKNLKKLESILGLS